MTEDRETLESVLGLADAALTRTMDHHAQCSFHGNVPTHVLDAVDAVRRSLGRRGWYDTSDSIPKDSAYRRGDYDGPWPDMEKGGWL